MTDWLAEKKNADRRESILGRIYAVLGAMPDEEYEAVRGDVVKTLKITLGTLNKGRKARQEKQRTERAARKPVTSKSIALIQSNKPQPSTIKRPDEITAQSFVFWDRWAAPLAYEAARIGPEVKAAYPLIPESAWREFVRVVSHQVHFCQAYLQCLAASWPERISKTDGRSVFKKLYALAIRGWLDQFALARDVPESHAYWPPGAAANRADLCKLTVYTAGGGRLLDALFQSVRSDRENDNHVAFAAGYSLKPASESTKGLKPPSLVRDRSHRWPLVTSGLAPGYRAVEPSEGLLVQSFGDPERVNCPWMHRADRPHDPSPLRVGVYRYGETAHEYIPGELTGAALKEESNYAEIEEAFVKAVKEIEYAYPGIPTDALGYLVCRGMLNEIDESATQALLYLVGTSGSGKTTIAMLAGEILGNETVKITINEDQQDAAQRLGYAFRERKRIICLDEFHLLYQSSKFKERTQVTQILQQLDRRHRFNAKYKDDETIDAQSVIVLTGTTIPSDFASKQLARRTLSYDFPELKQENQWLTTSGGTVGWRCRTMKNKVLADKIVSRAYDLISHPAIDFSHLELEGVFRCRRLSEHLNADVEARNAAYATLYMVWLHSYRRWKFSYDDVFQGVVNEMREKDAAKAEAFMSDEWGDADWIHPVNVMGSEGWLNLVHVHLSELRIIESIFNRIGPDSPASQIVNYFGKEEGEEGFGRLFGFGDDVQYTKLLVRQRAGLVCARFQLWSDHRRSSTVQIPVQDCPGLSNIWPKKLPTPPSPRQRIVHPNNETGISDWVHE